MKFAFFGTPKTSTYVLDALEAHGFIPTVVVTAPDRPKGREQTVEPTPVKVWATTRGIAVLQPESLGAENLGVLYESEWDIFVVASYGKILPEELLALPRYGVLNVHPSLLPKYRGTSPVRTAILDDAKTTGVSLMKLDEKMDHGPVLAQETIEYTEWPPKGSILEAFLFQKGGELLAETIPGYLAGEIKEQPQDDSTATYTKMIKKSDGEIDLSGDPYQNYLRYQAYDDWPGTFFLTDGKRVKITDARYVDGNFEILKVIPEGKKEIDYKTFLGNQN